MLDPFAILPMICLKPRADKFPGVKAEDGAIKGGGYLGGILRHIELVYELSYQFPVLFLS
jgi:hypothetical protein